MKKFIIAVCCIVVCVLLFDYLYYYQGVYIDFSPNKKPTTFVCTKDEKIYLDKGNGFEEFEIKGVDIGSGMPGEWSTDFGITKSDYLRWFKQIKEIPYIFYTVSGLTTTYIIQPGMLMIRN